MRRNILFVLLSVITTEVASTYTKEINHKTNLNNFTVRSDDKQNSFF